MPFGFKLSHRLSRIRLVTLAAVLTACEVPSTAPDQSRKIVGRVLVRPDTVALDPNQTLQFHAFGRTTGGDSVPVSVTWTASAGTITSDGSYTADASTYDAVVTATYASANLTGTSSVRKRRIVAIALTPSSAALVTGGTQQFTASGIRNTGDTVGVNVTYTATGGTISGSGLYAAGQSAGTFRVIAQQSSGTLADTSSVTISSTTPPPGTAGCANPQPGWIWCDDFEQDRLASYFEYISDNGSFARAAGVGRNGSYAMRAHFAAGQQSAGALHLAFGKTPDPYIRPVDAGTATYRELYWRMYLMNQPGWTGGGGDKLSRALIFASPTWAEAAFAHVWSGSGADANYLVLDPASGTDLQGTLVTTQYNDFANMRWLGAVRGATPIFDAAHVGAWHCVEAHARLNDSGMSNGVFQLWIDGNLQAQETGRNWVGTYAQYGFNAVFFENYWNAGSPQAQDRYLDDIIVSTAPIGCGDAAPPPPAPTPVASVTVSPARDTVAVGLTRQLAAVTKDASGNILAGRVITWASGNPAVATVSGSGLVTAVAPGTATITATSEGVSGTSSTMVTLILAAVVQVSPPRDTVLPGQTATLTATARDKNGNPLNGHPVTWTSLNPAVASVDASGVVTGIAPGIATIQATVDTANGTAFEQVETVTGAVPWVNEDFSTYTSTADLLADPRKLYSVTEDLMTSEIVLDRTVGYGTSTQSMRYDFPARAGNCTDYSIGRNINLPAPAADVYIEVVAKFQNGWTNATPGCSGVSNQDYKFLLPRVQTSGRFNVMVGTYNTEYTVGYPGNEDGFEGGSVAGIFDGNWHVFRFHAKVGPSGACTLWVDGKLVKDYGVVSMASNLIYGIALGRNINQGPPAAQSLWWGRVRVWNTNPGW